MTISRDEVEFKDSLWAHRSFFIGERFKTYTVDQSDFSVYPVLDEDTTKNVGFIRYRCIQSTM